MKNGKKAKSKTVKKGSSKKSAAGKAGGKSPQAVKASPQKKAVGKGAARPSSESKEARGKGAAVKKGRKGPAEGEIHFSNPAVAAAFKRAVKKYPSALKRLSD